MIRPLEKGKSKGDFIKKLDKTKIVSIIISEEVNAMEILYSKKALKFLAKLERNQSERIKEAIIGLTLTPPVGDIKPLHGFEDGRKRLRVGSYRVIFRIDTNGTVQVLLVLNIGNRGDIYKKGDD